MGWTVVTVLVAFAYHGAVGYARRRHWTARSLTLASAVSGLAPIATVVTERPGELLSHCWTDQDLRKLFA